MTPAPSSTITALGVSAVAVLAMGSTIAGTDPTGHEQSRRPRSPTGRVRPADGLPGARRRHDHLTIAVPDTWTDIITAPDTIDGAVVPQINAATDLEVGDADVRRPRCAVRRLPVHRRQRSAVPANASSPLRMRASDEVVPYDDGAFVGQWWRHTDCGPAGEAEWHVIVASPASERATVAVVVQLASPQDEACSTSSCSRSTSRRRRPGRRQPSPPRTTITSTPRRRPRRRHRGSDVVADPRDPQLVNDSGLLSVNVPSAGRSSRTSGRLNDDGSYRPTIVAAPDLRTSSMASTLPELACSALPPVVEVATMLANVAKPTTASPPGQLRSTTASSSA